MFAFVSLLAKFLGDPTKIWFDVVSPVLRSTSKPNGKSGNDRQLLFYSQHVLNHLHPMEFVPLTSKNPTSPRSFFGEKRKLEAKWECTTAGTGGNGHDENARRLLWGLETPRSGGTASSEAVGVETAGARAFFWRRHVCPGHIWKDQKKQEREIMETHLHMMKTMWFQPTVFF